MNDDDLINQVYRKIEREKVLINAANNMRQSSNPQVQQSLDLQIRESRKGIDYLEERMRELQMRRMEAMGGAGSNGGPTPPTHGSPQQRNARNAARPGSSAPPQREGGGEYPQDSGDYGDPGNGGYMNDMSGGHGMMPPRAPFGPPGPGSTMPKTRPNYTKLGGYGSSRVDYQRLTRMNRPHQIRYAIFRTSDTINAFSIRI